MKNRFLILSMVAATLFACSSDPMINDDFNETAEKRKSVPIKIKKLVGTYQLTGGDPATCGPAVLNAIGEGTVSHLGKSGLFEEWCFNGTIPDLGTRSVTITAANGDELWGRIVEVISSPPFISFEEIVIFEGGTGRFEKAEGEFRQYVELEPVSQFNGTFTLRGEGTFTY